MNSAARISKSFWNFALEGIGEAVHLYLEPIWTVGEWAKERIQRGSPRNRLAYIRLYLRISLIMLPACAYFIAVKIRLGFSMFSSSAAHAEIPSYWGIMLCTSIAWAIAAEESGLFRLEELYRPRGKSRRLLEALAFTYAIVMAVGFLYRQAVYSRLVVGISAVALFALVNTTCIVFRVALEMLRPRFEYEVRFLMVGTDRFARRISTLVQNAGVLPCRIIGYVRLPNQEVAVEGPVYEMDQVPRFSGTDSIHNVIVTPPHGDLNGLQSVLKRLGVPTLTVVDLGDVEVRDRLVDLGGIVMVETTVAETRRRYPLEKRVFDVVFSAAILLLTLPLASLVALAIKLTSRGPVFFVQERVGADGRVFRMYKFRTMHIGHEDESYNTLTRDGDPRRTKIGAFLRMSGLDELPEFLNVLKGDMSIVGPRPERPGFIDRFLEELNEYNLGQASRAGITGWAQVRGRGDSANLEPTEYDLYYLRNWSLTLDLQIIIMSFLQIFMRFSPKRNLARPA